MFASADAGVSWSALPLQQYLGLRVESMASEADLPGRLYLEGTWKGSHVVLRSGDGGRTFSEARLPGQLAAGRAAALSGPRLAVDPHHPQTLLLATALDGLWQSYNSGASWARVTTFPALPLNGEGLTFVSFADAPPGRKSSTLFVGVADPFFNLLHSEDGSKSWTAVVGGPTGVFPNHAAFGADGVLLLSYGDAPGGRKAEMAHGGVWSYTPGTRQWRDLTPAGALAAGFSEIALDARHPSILYAARSRSGSDGATLLMSRDSGTHWTGLPLGPGKPVRGITALLVDPGEPERLLYSVER